MSFSIASMPMKERARLKILAKTSLLQQSQQMEVDSEPVKIKSHIAGSFNQSTKKH